jgi:hypothetical protein
MPGYIAPRAPAMTPVDNLLEAMLMVDNVRSRANLITDPPAGGNSSMLSDPKLATSTPGGIVGGQV